MILNHQLKTMSSYGMVNMRLENPILRGVENHFKN